MRQCVLQLVFGIICFLTGWGAVAAVESVITSIDIGTVPVVQSQVEIDSDVVTRILSAEIDFHINGIRAGSSEREVLRRLGRPKKITDERVNYSEGPTIIFRNFEYDGLTVLFSRQEGPFSVQEVRVTGGSWNFRGIDVGSGRAKIREVLGLPVGEDIGYVGYETTMSDVHVEFILVDDRIVEIIGGYSGC